MGGAGQVPASCPPAAALRLLRRVGARTRKLLGAPQRRRGGRDRSGWRECASEILTTGGKENALSVERGIERNSRMNRGDLADLNAFVAVADHLSFRAASAQLGVTASALSHSMRQLEERLGGRLLHRTTRSVSVTAGGIGVVAARRAPS